VALGPIFASPSKPDAREPLGIGALREARLRVALPLVAIGGIGPDSLTEVLRAGADAAALISGIWGAPEGAGKRLRQLLRDARAALAGRPLAGRHLYLVGFMGAGKSTVGPLVARALARPFIDLDAEVERHCGCPIAELFARRGEPAFRREERDVLARVSRGREAVIALGGGALGAVASRRRVARGVSVWLDAPLAALRARCLRPGAPNRPLLQKPAQFERLYRARCKIYARADLRLPAGTAEPPALAEKIVARLAGAKSGRILPGARS
jgi:shikimate kinase